MLAGMRRMAGSLDGLSNGSDAGPRVAFDGPPGTDPRPS
jgi:hypothetical protein